MYALVLVMVAAAPKSPLVDGGLPRSVVEEVVALQASHVAACFDGGVPRHLELEWAVEPPGGSPAAVDARHPKAPEPATRCAVAAVQAWRFPAADAGTVVRQAWPVPTRRPQRLPVRDDEGVRAVVDEAVRGLAACAPGEAAGRVALHLAVGASGWVLDARVDGAAPPQDALATCVLARAAAWRFPPGPAATVRDVAVHFDFGASAPDAGPADDWTWAVPPAGDTAELPTALITNVVRHHEAAVHRCYATALRDAPGLAGVLKVAWTIDADGRPTDVRVHETGLDDMRLQGCVLEQVGQWRFPRPAGGAVVKVVYPFSLSPRRRR